MTRATIAERVVFDASAVLALLQQEPGVEKLESFLETATITSANLSEVVTKLVDWGSSPEEIDAIVESLALPVIDVSHALGMQAGILRQATKALGLSLGDRICLAAALQLNAVAVTTDRAWRRLKLPIRIEVVR